MRRSQLKDSKLGAIAIATLGALLAAALFGAALKELAQLSSFLCEVDGMNAFFI